MVSVPSSRMRSIFMAGLICGFASMASAQNPQPGEATGNGWNQEPGIGGYSTDLNPNAPYAGELQVAYDSALERYIMLIGEGTVFAYSESAGGLQWTTPISIFQLTGQPNTYVMPVGTGDDPRILGKDFYVYYTLYPPDGQGWNGAELRRLSVSCQ